MRIVISSLSRDPIYKQIADQIRDAVLSGELSEGDALPSIRGLAKELEVSVITTSRAYEELEKEGFIASVPGKGSFVAGHNTELIREKRMHLLEEKLGEAMGDAKQMGLSFDEIVEIMRLLYEGGE
ncbi:MAG TPA: GntR family transcriptional regulator [Firmicutes bacterium]|jgi:GntR family transcriptional regulator|nr:MAG: GntR family transcriptional regulator [Peptococcaceae bacterium 1109]HHT72109.1 GntR family transcriptional regulator [Bacillota bacterium]